MHTKYFSFYNVLIHLCLWILYAYIIRVKKYTKVLNQKTIVLWHVIFLCVGGNFLDSNFFLIKTKGILVVINVCLF